MARKLTVGIVLDDSLDRSDGVQQAVLAIGDKLSERGHNVHYIVSETQRTDIKNIHSIAKFVSMKFNGNSIRTPLPASGKKIKQLFSDVKFDALYVQMPFSPLLAGRVINRAPEESKIVGEFHILPFSKPAYFGTRMLGLFSFSYVRKFTKFFAVSKPAKKFLDDSYRVDASVLPNPVRYKFFNDYSKQNKNKKNKIVFIGRFEERKGVLQLIKAFHSLQTQAELVMMGDGPLRPEVMGYAKNHKLNVKFPGFVTEEEKAKQLSQAALAVLPSTSGESFGIVLAEAMAAGAGVTLGGNNPGYASVLGDWPDTLFNPDNIEEFTAIMDKYLSDNWLRKEQGELQHEAVKKYDIEVVADELLRYLG